MPSVGAPARSSSARPRAVVIGAPRAVVIGAPRAVVDRCSLGAINLGNKRRLR
ncbi:hypothetical protein FRACA_1890013 [Frankia canadensis]|uniref:Uncharacterized protein n=1 Tax=Frankia canadensis TaxID=1836972 RepID=A0A2I2KP42_9ACTN|nr:hypothetical protein FRACA_1890013 [Frankia canadensis]SOU54710.1 hypothetical protein FRACA_1890013 [Frankia canadensis]